MESNTKKHQFLPDPVQELNGNICRLCDLLEILLDSEAKEIKAVWKPKAAKADNYRSSSHSLTQPFVRKTVRKNIRPTK